MFDSRARRPLRRVPDSEWHELSCMPVIGASGLIFGLVAFLILSGLLERRIIPLIVSFAVGIFYGGTLLWGVLPTAGSAVSWDGHLCGAVAGGLAAWFLAREPRPRESVSV